MTDIIECWAQTHVPNYEVSNLGRVRSRALYPEGRILKPKMIGGYPYMRLGKKHSCFVHRLVAAAFIGPRPEGYEVRHKDDNRGNARFDNLEYGTRKQNMADMYARGRGNRPCGEKHSYSKLRETDIKEIRKLYADGVSQLALGRNYGVSGNAIAGVVKGRTWKHVT